MDNLVMAKPTGVGGLKNWTSSTLNGGQSTSSSIVEGDTRSRNQSCRAKVIGPFEGDNNNNDGDMLDRRMHQKNMTIATNMPALDLVASKTNKIERTISLKAASATASIKRDCPKSRESTSIQHHHRKSIPQAQQRQGSSPRAGLLTDVQRGSFDVYNIETALPKIDWDAMEAHLRAAKDEEKRRRNDREEIRRRLAMGIESDDVPEIEKFTRKPTLHSRLQNGMNLQICFMNETASDGSDAENPMKESCHDKTTRNKGLIKTAVVNGLKKDPYVSLPARVSSLDFQSISVEDKPPAEMDFFAQQAKLQNEARIALIQAKELARVQMQVERQQRKHTRISDLVRQSLEKLGIPFPWDCRRLSRQILTELNIAQLQVIANDLHSQIEGLNEELVRMLLNRDDLHMEQDSMLVDIEDLTRYLTAKQAALEPSSGPISLPVHQQVTPPPLSTKQRLFNRSLARLPGLRK